MATAFNVLITRKDYGVVTVWAEDEDEAVVEAARYARWLDEGGMLHLDAEPGEPEVDGVLGAIEDLPDDPSHPAYMKFNRVVTETGS